MRRRLLWLMFTAGLCGVFSCCATRESQSPFRKLPPQQLQQDYAVLKHILQTYHPSLYWYTSRDSMERIFRYFEQSLQDSMSEPQFGYRVVAPTLSAIRCGHTSFSFSRHYNRLVDSRMLPSFPLLLKVWPDTMVALYNLRKGDSSFPRGTLITSINGKREPEISSILFRYLPADGYAEGIHYIRLSNSFPYYHRSVFGLSRSYQVTYLDSSGQEKRAMIPWYDPRPDSTQKRDSLSVKELNKQRREARKKRVKVTARQQRSASRSLAIDTTHRIGIMELNTFAGGNRLHSFFRRSFRTLRKMDIRDLVLDIRINGGGKINHYTDLSRYLRREPFRVADTAFSIRRHFGKDRRYFDYSFTNWMILQLFTRKNADQYHFRYWENKTFRPRQKKLYNGNVYLITAGPTFSAGSLLAHTLKGQSNVTIVGEETGGGAYGNNGIMIPKFVLPHSGLQVRLPLFRLVQYGHGEKDGRGVIPDVIVPPTWQGVRENRDLKMEKVYELILSARRR